MVLAQPHTKTEWLADVSAFVDAQFSPELLYEPLAVPSSRLPSANAAQGRENAVSDVGLFAFLLRHWNRLLIVVGLN